MYIHTICSGSQNQYKKRLLRVGRREGQRVINRTLANVSGWTEEQIEKLQSALAARRIFRRTELQPDAERSVFSLLLAGGIEPWRLMQTDLKGPPLGSAK